VEETGNEPERCECTDDASRQERRFFKRRREAQRFADVFDFRL
jgi:hypothetical protein